MSIGKLIKERRKFLGLTLEQVGDAVGVKKSTVMKWESGKIQNMCRDRIKPLSDILGIHPILLINDETFSMKNKEPAHLDDGRGGLKPCPFCGGEAEEDYGFFDYNYFGVHCTKCDAYVFVYDREGGREKANEKWNDRIL